jgi:hypothetical protein
LSLVYGDWTYGWLPYAAAPLPRGISRDQPSSDHSRQVADENCTGEVRLR